LGHVEAALGVDGQRLFDPDWDTAAGFVMSPPLNPDPQTKVHLMKQLQNGNLHCVATDNCTFFCWHRISSK
jgi:dihydropyrimidinase